LFGTAADAARGDDFAQGRGVRDAPTRPALSPAL
jgi:hypothetical protein